LEREERERGEPRGDDGRRSGRSVVFKEKVISEVDVLMEEEQGRYLHRCSA